MAHPHQTWGIIFSKCSLCPEAETLSLLLFCKSFLRQNVHLKGLGYPLLTSAKTCAERQRKARLATGRQTDKVLHWNEE